MSDKTIGQYRILDKIGEGGMGVVYEAEQQHPKRRVALKVIRGGQFVDETTIRMFQREAQSLALLKHASIASIYESGHTDDGAHFFAMELVHGKTLDEWLAGRPSEGLSQTEMKMRLGLFRQICDGVSYAHQRGVIHRDLKPGNILVLDEPTESSDTTRYQGPGIKILDFGLARITETDVQVASMVTEVGTIIGTLHYMSPEQVQGIPGNIDVRSDVYALGVLLYEILTRHLPYPIREAGFHDALGIILDTSPTPLSKLWPGDKKVARDLDIIALKALEKDVSRRYQSAPALAEDIDHFLNNQPILARAPSTMYQLQKMVKRHTVPFALAASLALMVVGFGFVSAAQARRIAQERDAAEIARDESEAVTDFITGMLASADPNVQARDVRVVDVMGVAADNLKVDFAEQPQIRARLHHTIGEVYSALSLFSEADTNLQSAIDIRQSEMGLDSPETLDSMYQLAKSYTYQGRLPESAELGLQVVDGYNNALGPGDFRTLIAKNLLAVVYLYMRRFEEAEPIAMEALVYWKEREAEGIWFEGDEKKELEERQTALNTVVGLYLESGRFDECEVLALEVLKNDRLISGPEHPYTLGSMHNVARVYQETGRFTEAESLYVETLALRKRVLGEPHDRTLMTMGNLAEVYAAQERFEDAETLFHRTIALYSGNPNLGETHDRAQRYIKALVEMYEAWGKPDQAALWREKLIPNL